MNDAPIKSALRRFLLAHVFIQVVNLVYNINQAGKSRKYTKEEYLYINEASIQSKIELCEL